MRAFIAVTISWLLLVCGGLDAKFGALMAAGRGQTERPKPTIQEQALEIPAGTMIELKLHDKKKVRGRMAQLTSEAVEIQVAAGGKIDSRQYKFADIKSIKEVRKDNGGSGVRNGVIAGLVAVGVLILVGVILTAARGSD